MNTNREDLRIAEEAADWHLKLQMESEGGCREGFIAWLKHSPRHVEEFLLMSATMHVAQQGGRASQLDVDALLHDVVTDVVTLESVAHAQTLAPAGRPRPWAIRLAAAAVLIAAVFGLWRWNTGAHTYVTPVGEQRNIKLADGSFVYLNTRSRVKVDYSQERRDVRLLEGEALFVVARQPARPFRVLTDSTVIQAVGTQFNVYRRNEGTTVSVIEGQVKLARSDALLSAGEQVDVMDDGRVSRERADDVGNSIAWRQRRLVFNSDTLADIAHEFNRYNRMQIRVEGEAAEQRRFTAVFNADEPQALLMFLRDDPLLAIEAGDGEASIRAR
jgi:transmembrane sensor